LRTMTCLCHCTKLATVFPDGLGYIQHSIYHTEYRHEYIYISYFNMFHLLYINQVHNI